MNTGVTRSRAAILYFGGWGLQTLLHLHTRLQAIQAQRVAQGAEGPDITEVTSMAALLPGLSSGEGGATSVQLHMRQMRPDIPLPPFYLEELLERLEPRHSRGRNGRGGVWSGDQPVDAVGTSLVDLVQSDSQRRSQRLLTATDPLLTRLSDLALGEIEGTFGGALSRGALFRSALRQGTAVARILDTHLLAPIRQDNLAPGDPFVQTTLYVVAPLFEPLTSALLWPSMVHLLNYLGRRHVAQIVGIFATGSYAGDSSRAVEDATSYASLSELEALTGLHPDAAVALEENDLPDALRRHSDFVSWVGRRLFDRLYLVDREKSNQGLIHNSYELSVLVGNALEALVTTAGGLHVEEQVAIDLRHADNRPYSLLGAAADYVPLESLFEAVHQQEEKRLVREVLLAGAAASPATPGDSARQAEDVGRSAPAVDQELGIQRDQLLTRLVAAMPSLFDDASPATIGDLRVHRDFVLPPAVAAELRGLPPGAWLAGFEAHLESLDHQYEKVAGASALARIWGEPGAVPTGATEAPQLVAATAGIMRRRVVELLASSPNGLAVAQEHLAGWIGRVERERRQLADEAAEGQRVLDEARRQLALRDWNGRYQRTLARQPSLGNTALRATLLFAVVLAIATLYFALFRRPLDPMVDGLTLAGILVGSYVGGILFFRRRMSGMQRLRRERLALAQQEYTARIQLRVHEGMTGAYGHLAQTLRQMKRALEETHEALALWAVDRGMPPVPPSPRYASHLYRPHVNERLWTLCRDHLRRREDEDGRRSQERLVAHWGTSSWRRRLEELLLAPDTLHQSLSGALYDLLREGVQEVVAVGEGTPAHGDGATSATHRQQSRQELVRLLAQEANLEHVLWRDGVRSGRDDLLHRHLEALRGNARPAANYEVSDRVATHGIPVDFAAVPGLPSSDLDPAILHTFRAAAMPTGDPFRLSFVRTVHGLRLDDLESSRRYRLELSLLPPALLERVALDPQGIRWIYGIEPPEVPEPQERYDAASADGYADYGNGAYEGSYDSARSSGYEGSYGSYAEQPDPHAESYSSGYADSHRDVYPESYSDRYSEEYAEAFPEAFSETYPESYSESYSGSYQEPYADARSDGGDGAGDEIGRGDGYDEMSDETPDETPDDGWTRWSAR